MMTFKNDIALDALCQVTGLGKTFVTVVAVPLKTF
jgi:hypothetical protein